MSQNVIQFLCRYNFKPHYTHFNILLEDYNPDTEFVSYKKLPMSLFIFYDIFMVKFIKIGSQQVFKHEIASVTVAL